MEGMDTLTGLGRNATLVYSDVVHGRAEWARSIRRDCVHRQVSRPNEDGFVLMNLRNGKQSGAVAFKEIKTMSEFEHKSIVLLNIVYRLQLQR